MKTFQRILAVVLCLVMSLSVLGTVAFAAEGEPQITAATIDTSKKGSITVHKYEKGDGATADGTGEVQDTTGFTAMEGVEFTIYQVMNANQVLAYYDGTNAVSVDWQKFVSGSAGNYTVNKFAEDDTTLTGEMVAAKAKATETTDKNGVAKFEGLGVGMYIIIESKYPAEVTSPADPFLVSVPMTATNKTDWLYDINVYPKNDTSRGNVTIQKYSNDFSTLMKSGDVKFTLKKLNGNAWEYVNLKNNEYTFSSTTAQEFTLTDGKLTFSNLPYGEYRLTETATADGYILDSRPVEFKIDDKGVITLTTTGVDTVSSVSGENGLTIKIINEKPDVDKTLADGEEDANAAVGDTVSFKVTVDVPLNITELKTFVVTDTPSGLDDDLDTVVVKYNGSAISTDAYTVSRYPFNGVIGFKITFKTEKMDDYAGKQLAVTYDAEVLTQDKATNTADLEYSNEISTDSTKEPDTNHIQDMGAVYSYRIQITKYADSLNGATMAGVEFELIDANGNTLELIQTGDGIYKVPTSTEANTTTKLVTGLVTGTNGTLHIYGLDSGTYYLKETKTKDGYNLLKDKVEVNLNLDTVTEWETSSDFVEGVLVKETYKSTTYTLGGNTVSGNVVPQTIINKKGFELPTTGGIGTLMFFIIGGVLIAGGICLITVPNKKRSV